MIVLGLDPSLCAFGWAAFEDQRPTAAGVWTTFADRAVNGVTKDNAERIAFIAQQLWDLGNRLKPEHIFVEGQVYMPKTSLDAIASAHRTRGLVEMLGAVLGVQVTEFSPQAVKKGLGIVLAPRVSREPYKVVVVNGRTTFKRKKAPAMASKQEVRDAVVQLYPESAEWMPTTKDAAEAASDAIAVAHLGLKTMAYNERISSGSSR